MKKHIFFINDLNKLVLEKDSSILIALTFQSLGHETFVLFEDDFYIQNKGEIKLKCYRFSGQVGEDFYVRNFKLEEDELVLMDDSIHFHMRIDPPYDSRYQRYLWMQDFLMQKGVFCLNNPIGIMTNNEKLEAYKRNNSLPSFLGSSWTGANLFLEEQIAQGVEEFIFKPLDLYQGIGVEKVNLKDSLEEVFLKKCLEYEGPVVIQPFEKSVTEGEIRSIYFNGIELGTILKTPKKGEYLANIAQGAKYEAYNMSQELKDECKEICDDLSKSGVYFIAFDILGSKISEVNVTCPGLLVEVSSAMKKNLAIPIGTSTLNK